MTDRERLALLRYAEKHLKLTKKGYAEEPVGPGPEWTKALDALAKLARDLTSHVPPLGAVYVGGKSVLDHDLTHFTAGIPLYPAFDDGWVAGRVVIAPEALTVIAPPTSANPGHAFYAQGVSKLRYWFGHLDRDHAAGTKFRKGDAVGKIAYQPNGKSHVHVGINVELLLGAGKQLLHHTDYSHGAPTVGSQLRKVL